MPEVRKRVGRYDLLEVIGRGGAAVVYLARQRDLQRHVALKELAPYYAADSSFAERFVQESYLAGSMSHANVVTVHEYFEDDAVPYIAMEYLPHGSLRQYVAKLSTPQIAGVLEGVLAGLSHGEAHGIVHRDLKPENLLVAADGRVKIADFGVARAYNRAATRAVVTSTGTTIGTPAYMSPEQALGGELTPATDLYSLGVVAWELLAGQVPFEETDTPVAVLYRHVHEPVPSVRTVAPDVDARIADWLDRLLAKRPEDRFQSADAAWLELEDVVLDLAGPRWRREARLVVDDRVPASEQSLTPAEFDGADPVTPAASKEEPRQRVAETVTDLEPEHEPPKTTIAPKKRPQPSHTTMLRRARRHPDADQSAAPAAQDTTRRRLTVAAIVVAMAGRRRRRAARELERLQPPAAGGDTPTHRGERQRAARLDHRRSRGGARAGAGRAEKRGHAARSGNRGGGSGEGVRDRRDPGRSARRQEPGRIPAARDAREHRHRVRNAGGSRPGRQSEALERRVGRD